MGVQLVYLITFSAVHGWIFLRHWLGRQLADS
jgi:hypothetical protein